MKKETKYFLSSRVCSVDEYNRIIIDDKYKTSQAIQKFYRVLCEGFALNNYPITAYSKRPIDKISSGKLYVPPKDENVKGVNYHYMCSINIKGVDFVFSLLSAFFWFLSPWNIKRDDVVIYDPLSVAQNFGCYLACKLRRISTVAFVTDIINIYSKGYRTKSSFKKMSSWLQVHADAMIFVTEQMNDVANPYQKPYIVIEGFVDKGMENRSINQLHPISPKVILYSGGLEKHYGLDMLVNGFIAANIPDSELHIYGDGNYADEIRRKAVLNKKIKFWGIKDNETVVLEQMKAFLLVNPRYTNADYTKYSFPGKNLEYMVSGTATLTTALPGMPKDYYPFVFIIQNETVDGMKEKLQELLLKSSEEMRSFGESAKRWMLTNKNNKVQVHKLVVFLKDLGR